MQRCCPAGLRFPHFGWAQGWNADVGHVARVQQEDRRVLQQKGTIMIAAFLAHVTLVAGHERVSQIHFASPWDQRHKLDDGPD